MDNDIKKKEGSGKKNCCIAALIFLAILVIGVVSLTFYVKNNWQKVFGKIFITTVDVQMDAMQFPETEQIGYLSGANLAVDHIYANKLSIEQTKKFITELVKDNNGIQYSVVLKALEYAKESEVPQFKQSQYLAGKKDISRLVEGIKTGVISESDFKSLERLMTFNSFAKGKSFKINKKEFKSVTYEDVLVLMQEAKKIADKVNIEDKLFSNKLGKYLKNKIEEKIKNKKNE